MYRVARGILNRGQDIEDAIQNTTLIAFNQITTLRNEKLFKTWLIRILINECNKIYKYNKNSICEIIEEAYTVDTNENIDLYNAISRLSDELRISTILFYFDRKLREMAKKSNIKESEELKNKIDITCENLKGKRFNNKIYATVAAIFIAVVIAIGSYIPTYAKEAPFIKKVIIYFTEKYDSVNKGHEESSQNENIIVESNGYTISIEDIYYDREEMTIFYKIKSDKHLNREAKYLLKSEFEGEVDTEVRLGNQEGEFIDEYTYGGMNQWYISEINGAELSEVFKGRLKINGLGLQREDNYEEILLQLDSIPLILDSTIIKGEEIDINKTVYTDDYSTEYIKATINPVRMDLESRVRREYISEYDIYSGRYYIENVLWDSKKGYLKSEFTSERYSGEINIHRYELPSEVLLLIDTIMDLLNIVRITLKVLRLRKK